MTAEEEIAQLKKELARERADNAQVGQMLEEMQRRPGAVEGCILMRWQRLAHPGTANMRLARTSKFPPATEALTA